HRDVPPRERARWYASHAYRARPEFAGAPRTHGRHWPGRVHLRRDFHRTDALVATATVGTQTVTSNVAQVTWTPGPHTTFLSLNASRSSGTVNTPLPLTATLVDASVSPAVALSNATLSFALAGQTCPAITNSSGTASCTLTPTAAAGAYSLTANFTGTNQLLASTASKTVDLVATANPPPNCSQARPSVTTLWPPNH